MTKMEGDQLLEIYNAIFLCYRKGQYDIINIKNQPKSDATKAVFSCFHKTNRRGIFKIKKNATQTKNKTKKHFNDAKAHEETINFMLYAFCTIHNLNYCNSVYKKLYPPHTLYRFDLSQVTFVDFVGFISPETKRTSR